MLTVIIPAWNRENCLRRSVLSVLSQIQTDDQILIVDDNSTDNTAKIAEKLASEDQRINFLRNNRKKGAPGSRNTGLFSEKNQNDWIAFLDSDDEWRSGFYTKMTEAISKSPETDIFTCHTQIVEELDDNSTQKLGEFKWIAEGNILKSLLNGSCYVDMNGAIIRRSRLLEINGFDENCPSYQEWDLHIRLAETCSYKCVPELLVNYYQHHGQMSKSGIKSILGLLFVMRKHRRKWKELTGRPGWIARCKATSEEIARFKIDSVAIWLEAIRIDPYFLFPYLTQRLRRLRLLLKR